MQQVLGTYVQYTCINKRESIKLFAAHPKEQWKSLWNTPLCFTNEAAARLETAVRVRVFERRPAGCKSMCIWKVLSPTE
jgi:hypothetical protein